MDFRTMLPTSRSHSCHVSCFPPGAHRQKHRIHPQVKRFSSVYPQFSRSPGDQGTLGGPFHESLVPHMPSCALRPVLHLPAPPREKGRASAGMRLFIKKPRDRFRWCTGNPVSFRPAPPIGQSRLKGSPACLFRVRPRPRSGFRQRSPGVCARFHGSGGRSPGFR